MTEALGTVHARRRGLLQGWRWSVDPKLVFEQMAAPVVEIIDVFYILRTMKENVIQLTI
jgi:hypothetical protein